MKKYVVLLFALLLIAGCNNDDNNNQNPFLPNYNFSIDINKDLPLYSPLNFTGNPVFINQSGVGINGVIVMNTGSGYTAFEATCPNQNITSCSQLDIEGINAVCPCDGVEYSLFTGLGAGVQYPLKSYRVQVVSASVIRVSN
ncbi:hypothetical protein CHU92_03830 [Flavobacterium cyanobacteriorum]|uniref:Rieske domain-containing protein n=1 Tax=Flavobacterium cyanobacteriorum TaxID=2022802 RepID=A0A255ZMV6_9FLAO|nr:hypothetical protein [Flavobacterium cyanobacteriorum]OYQ42749.1 hypothetical protein CHU92_03830 [Flavobacterium cyanobacteriorum]